MKTDRFRSSIDRVDDHYDVISYDNVNMPIVGYLDGTPTIYSIKHLITNGKLAWQKDPERYGIEQGRLPILPAIVLPTLFSDDSLRALRGSACKAFNNTGIQVSSFEPVVFGFETKDKEDPIQFYPWDAGLSITLGYRNKNFKILGPAVISFDHAIADNVKEGAIGYSMFEEIVQAHLTQLRYSFFDIVAIHMPPLAEDSSTGGIFASMGKDYCKIPFTIAEQPFDLQILYGFNEFGGIPQTSHLRELVALPGFREYLKTISETWDSNFKREIAKWPEEYKAMSTKLSCDIVSHIRSKIEASDREDIDKA